MGYNQKKGYTFIELIMVMVIIAVLGISGAFLMSYFIQNAVYIPNKLNLNMLISDAFDIMVEGDEQAGGLRTSRQITDIRRRRVIFVDQNGQTVRFILRNNTQQLFRRIGSPAAQLMPYYQTTAIDLSAPNNTMFTYYDANENITNDPASVRRIEISLIAQTGTGSFDEWEGRAEASTSVAVHDLSTAPAFP